MGSGAGLTCAGLLSGKSLCLISWLWTIKCPPSAFTEDISFHAPPRGCKRPASLPSFSVTSIHCGYGLPVCGVSVRSQRPAKGDFWASSKAPDNAASTRSFFISVQCNAAACQNSHPARAVVLADS